MNTFTATIIVLTFLSGSPLPSTQVITLPIQNESFCEPVITQVTEDIQNAAPEITSSFITSCVKTGNPNQQSEARTGLVNGGQSGKFPGQ